MIAFLRSIRVDRCRFALRRVAGAVAVLLVASQAVAPLLLMCWATATAPTAMSSMAHEHGMLPHGQPARAPTHKHSTNCNHSMAGAGCCVGTTCSNAVTEALVKLVDSREPRPAAITAPAGNLLSPDIAPAVPPPRV